MVSLELALVYLRQGLTHRVQDLAEEMTIIFRSHELHRHASYNQKLWIGIRERAAYPSSRVQ